MSSNDPKGFIVKQCRKEGKFEMEEKALAKLFPGGPSPEALGVFCSKHQLRWSWKNSVYRFSLVEPDLRVW